MFLRTFTHRVVLRSCARCCQFVRDATQASYEPYVMAVLIASSSSFLTPMATPSNAIVWKPGRYKFQDYMKLGVPLTILYLFIAGALIPMVFSF